MKKQFMRIAGVNLFNGFFKTTALVLVLSASAYHAGAQATQVSAKAEQKAPGVNIAEINPLGTSDGMLLFEVKVNNASGERFRVIVKDVDGSVLFQNYYQDKNFAKKFMIPRPDGDRLIFLVKSPSGNTSQSFEINSSTRVIEDVVVTKI